MMVLANSIETMSGIVPRKAAPSRPLPMHRLLTPHQTGLRVKRPVAKVINCSAPMMKQVSAPVTKIVLRSRVTPNPGSDRRPVGAVRVVRPGSTR